MTKTALITGTSSGIGKATAETLAQNDFNLIITGRREDKLIDLKEKLLKEHDINVLALNFDVRDKQQVEKAINNLDKEWQEIDVLVNNAGLAVGFSDIDNGNIDDWERMIDTNLKGLLYVTRFVAPLMIKQQKGHIINIGSIAGKETYPKGNVYCATKHGVDSLSKAMRIDMLKHNIKVTQICPGMVETEFSIVRFKGDKDKADKVYKGLTPLFAEDIAQAILFAVTRPPHVNINDMLIMPSAQASATISHRI